MMGDIVGDTIPWTGSWTKPNQNKMRRELSISVHLSKLSDCVCNDAPVAMFSHLPQLWAKVNSYFEFPLLNILLQQEEKK